MLSRPDKTMEDRHQGFGHLSIAIPSWRYFFQHPGVIHHTGRDLEQRQESLILYKIDTSPYYTSDFYVHNQVHREHFEFLISLPCIAPAGCQQVVLYDLCRTGALT